MRSPKRSPNHKRRIKTILDQFGNTHARKQLAKFEETDGYMCKVAATKEEISALIEAGFEYVCQKGDLMMFRKRK
jgi:hypothetical protein